MSDPFNLRPADPAWVAKCDALLKQAIGELDGLVCLIVMQEGKKMYVGMDGYEKAGPEIGQTLRMMENDPSRLLAGLSVAVKISERMKQKTKQ